MLNLRMESCRTQFVFLVLVGLIALPMRAGVIPGRWDKVSQLESETPIIVYLKNGDRVQGHFTSLLESDLKVLVHRSSAVIPKADIQAITTRPNDDMADGACIGAGIGAGIMYAMAANPGKDFSAGGKLYFTMIGAAIGAVVGAAADSTFKPTANILYSAPRTFSQ